MMLFYILDNFKIKEQINIFKLMAIFRISLVITIPKQVLLLLLNLYTL